MTTKTHPPPRQGIQWRCLVESLTMSFVPLVLLPLPHWRKTRELGSALVSRRWLLSGDAGLTDF